MKALALFSLTLAYSFYGSHFAIITITNNCPYTIWPAILTSDQKPQLQNTGYVAAANTATTINVPIPWKGRMWARTGCSTFAGGRFSCVTGDCGDAVACNGSGGATPATLVEVMLNVTQDYYDISLVDGFNLPVSVSPQGGSGANCTQSSCAANVNSVCPSELTVKGTDGSVAACKSACTAFLLPQYCCTDAFSTPTNCKATNYSSIFKNDCPQAYSYAYDDPSSTFSCMGSPNYAVTFCP